MSRTDEAAPAATPAPVQAQAPLTYIPEHLVEKILASRAVLEGERKQVTVLFADMKGSMELLADQASHRDALTYLRAGGRCVLPC